MSEQAGDTTAQPRCEAEVTFNRASWGMYGTIECTQESCEIPLSEFEVPFNPNENDQLALRRQMARFLCRECPRLEEPKGFEGFPTSQLPVEILTGGKNRLGGFCGQSDTGL